MEIKTENERLAVVETEVKNVKGMLEKMDTKLDSLVTRSDYTTLSERVTKLETKNTIKATLTWVILVASVIVNIIMTYQLFTRR